MLKSTTQSKRITEELENVEKTNTFDIESVTIEHPNAAAKLSKPIKQPKIINQQPNKIKVCLESKTADRTLQLDLVERYVPPRKCSQSHKIKIVNSTKYDEQLKLTRSSIKNELFEII